LIPFFSGNQLRELQVAASVRFPARRDSHRLPQCFLLVSPPAAVVEEVFPRLGRRPASTNEPPAFVFLTMVELF
jgi:hypothetical protein